MASTTSDSDAQSWVFPPRGIDVPPIAATGNFGPVHFGDSMVLDWSPSTSPDVVLTCFSQLQNQTSSWAVRGEEPPVTYQFTETAIQQGATDLTFCHFYFKPSLHGNTIVFQFDNVPQAKAVTWSATSASSTTSSTISSTISSTTSTATSSSTAKPTSTSNSSTSLVSPTDTSTNSSAEGVSNSTSSGLSAGTSAGIGVGVALGVLLLAGIAAFFLWRRRRASRTVPAGSNGPFEAPAGMQQYDGTSTTYYSPQSSHPSGVYQDSMVYKPMSPAELHGAYQPSELQENHRPSELQ